MYSKISVIKSLVLQGKADPTQNIMIPYRDSKLTRVLQNSLNSTSKSCILATLSPSE